MHPTTLKSMKHFLGKVCTILTKPINRNFDEIISREYFSVRVQDISEDGIWGTHPYNDTVSFFRMDQLVSIQEEFELDPTNPTHAAMMSEFEKQTGQKVTTDLKMPAKQKPPEPIVNEPEKPKDAMKTFVNVDNLKGLASQTRQMYENMKLVQLGPLKR